MCWQSTHVLAGAFSPSPLPSRVTLHQSWGEHHSAALDPSAMAAFSSIFPHCQAAVEAQRNIIQARSLISLVHMGGIYHGAWLS